MPQDLIPTLQEIGQISQCLAEEVKKSTADEDTDEQELATRIIAVANKNNGKGLAFALKTVVELDKDNDKFNNELEKLGRENGQDDVDSLEAWNRYTLNEIAFDLFQKMAFYCYYNQDASSKDKKYSITALVKALTYCEKAMKMLDDDEDSVKLLDYLEPGDARTELINDDLLPVLQLLNIFISKRLYKKLDDLKKPLSSSEREHKNKQLGVIQAIIENTTLALDLLKYAANANLSQLNPRGKELFCELAGMRADALRAKGLFYARSEERQSDALDDLQEAHLLYNKIELITRERIAAYRITNPDEREERDELLSLLTNISKNKTICRKQSNTLQEKLNAQDSTALLIQALTAPSLANRTRKRSLELATTSPTGVEKKRPKEARCDETSPPEKQASGNTSSSAAAVVDSQMPAQFTTQTTQHVPTLFKVKTPIARLQDAPGEQAKPA